MGQATTQTDESVEKAGVLEGVGGLSARVNSALFGRFVNAHSFRTGKVDEFGPVLNGRSETPCSYRTVNNKNALDHETVRLERMISNLLRIL